MSQLPARATGPVRVALAGALAWATVLLSLTSSPAAAELAAVSLVVIALASALGCAPRAAVLLLVRVVGPVAAGEPGRPVLRSRATDPTHHPLAPRAPGLG